VLPLAAINPVPIQHIAELAMASKDKTPFFSIIISTRNRPELFLLALQSVLEQTFCEKQIVVVIDGSADSYIARYREIQKQFDGVLFFELPHRPSGHGQSYAMNYGVHKASGQYFCFLDDDDHWADNEYLKKLFDNLAASKSAVDVHYSNQIAVYANSAVKSENVWIEDLIPRLATQKRNHGDSYFVDVGFLLSSGGFAHLNCSVFRREFYLALGGMDEAIRYENDRDMYIRSIDAARVILFSTNYMSVHNIPDVSKKNNMSTVSSEIEKKVFQMRVYDKGISFSKHIEVVRFCCKAKVYELKHAARILAGHKQYTAAAHYAKAALIDGFNLRWLAYTLYLIFQKVLKPNSVYKDYFQ
jgi:glycosyltransferase involved in cell wall biosynthesis